MIETSEKKLMGDVTGYFFWPRAQIASEKEESFRCQLPVGITVQALKNAGFYSGKIDGKIGPGSKKAIEAFQQSKGLKADGKVGPKTWAALEPFLNGKESSASLAGAGTAASATATTD